MKFKLIIAPDREEEITAAVHQRSSLTDAVEQLVLQHTGNDRIAAYWDEEVRLLPFSQIECITVLEGKTYAIDRKNRHYRLKQRLYEVEQMLPSCFIRINKSAIANENCLERFRAGYSSAVDAVFQCGYTEYVSRRCFTQIKRRFDRK